MNTNRRPALAPLCLVLWALVLAVPPADAQTVAGTRPAAAPSPVAVTQVVAAPSPVALTQPVASVVPVAQPAVAAAPAAVAPAVAPTAIPAPAAMPQVTPLSPQPPQPPQAQAAPQAQTPRPAQPAQPPQPPQPSPAPAPPRESVPDLNVRVDVTIIDQTEASPPVKKSIGLTVAEGRNGSVRSGVTVPLLSTSSGPTASGSPVASYNYRNMGLSLDVRNVSVRGSSVALSLSVEYNPVDEKTSGASTAMATTIPSQQVPPSFATFQQSLSLVLESGKPLMVAQSSDPVPGRDRKTMLEVKATILK